MDRMAAQEQHLPLVGRQLLTPVAEAVETTFLTKITAVLAAAAGVLIFLPHHL
jgi:hypothetical protein